MCSQTCSRVFGYMWMWMYMHVCSRTRGGQRFLTVVFTVTFHFVPWAGVSRNVELTGLLVSLASLPQECSTPISQDCGDNRGQPHPWVLLHGCHGSKLQSSHSCSPARHPLNHRPGFNMRFLYAKLYLLVNFVIRFLQENIRELHELTLGCTCLILFT